MVDVVQQYFLDNGEEQVPTFGLTGGQTVGIYD